MNYSYKIISIVMMISYFNAVGMVKMIREQRQKLEEQVKILENTGNQLLSTGHALQNDLVMVVNENQKKVAHYKALIQFPVDMLSNPMATLEGIITRELASQPTLRDVLLKVINSSVFRPAYLTIVNAALVAARVPALPEVLRNFMMVLQTAAGTMDTVKGKFAPFVVELYSFVDIEKAKQDLKLPANSYQRVTLEFVSTYPEYVQKIYAQHTNGGKFDPKGIYKNLWLTRNHFLEAAQELKDLETFLANFE